MQSAALVLFVVLNWPLIHRVWRHRAKPRLKSDGSGFEGSLRRWEVSTLTGTVRNVQAETRVSGSGQITPVGAGYATSGGSIRIRSDHYETIRIERADGRQEDVRLMNFSASPSIGDVLTVCFGRKRGRSVAFAVLNQTTRGQTLNVQNLFSLREGGRGRQTVFALSLVFGSVLSVATSILLGAGWLIVFWIALLALFVVGGRRVAKVDLTPLWNLAGGDAQTQAVTP